MRKAYKFFGWVSALGAFGFILWANQEFDSDTTFVLFLFATTAGLCLFFWCFWFAQFIGRVEALESAVKEIRGGEENG